MIPVIIAIIVVIIFIVIVTKAIIAVIIVITENIILYPKRLNHERYRVIVPLKDKEGVNIHC